MAGDEALKLRPWAIDGDRLDPEDTDPSLTRTIGFPKAWSDSNGNQSPRAFWNQRLCELTIAAYRFLRWGVDPYDPLVDYPVNARCSMGRNLYTAVTANGPKSSNAASPLLVGQTVWKKVVSQRAVPDAPNQVTVVDGNGQLDFFWNCPRDNGQAITSFELQWRRKGNSTWESTITVTYPFYFLRGLQNFVIYQARTRARNAIGFSAWSPIVQSQPQAVAPSQIVGIVAIGGDGVINVSWDPPDDGGLDITHYTVFWRTADQIYSSSQRRLRTTSLSAQIPNVANGTPLFIMIRCRNTVGRSPNSDDVSATPQAPPPPPPSAPPDTIPGQVGVGSSTVLNGGILWQFPIPTDGNRRLSAFAIQVREHGQNWPSESIMTPSSCHFQRSIVAGRTYEARAKAVNALGMSAHWSQIVVSEV